MPSLEQIQELIHRAQALPDGPVKVCVFEEAVRLADVCASMDWRFYTRHELIRAAFCCDEPDKLIVALTWCLAKCDELGSCFDQGRLLWGCKFALSYATCFPHISRTQIDALQQDVTERYRRFGASLRMPYLRGMVNELAMGSLEKSAEFRRRWLLAPVDEFAEPPAWERYFEAWHLIENGDMDRALEHGMPILSGVQAAAEVYPWMACLFLFEFLKRRDSAQAIATHRQSYRQCAENPKFVSHIGTHLHFLALTGNVARVTRLFEKHLGWATHNRVPSALFSFHLGAWAAFRLIKVQHGNTLHLRLPKDFAQWRDDGVYDCAVLADWFEQQVRDLEVKFNQRNGTARYSQFVSNVFELEAAAVSWPIG